MAVTCTEPCTSCGRTCHHDSRELALCDRCRPQGYRTGAYVEPHPPEPEVCDYCKGSYCACLQAQAAKNQARRARSFAACAIALSLISLAFAFAAVALRH